MALLDAPIPRWMKAWIWFASVTCIMDGLFIILRPHSLPGGSLAFIFPQYKHYIEIDKYYSDSSDAYVFVQGLTALVEYPAGLVAMLLSPKHIRVSKLVLTSTNTMNSWKTVMYFIYTYDVLHGGRELNGFLEEFFVMFLPMSLWTVIPAYIAYTFWSEFLQAAESRDMKESEEEAGENGTDIVDDSNSPKKYNLRHRKI